MASFDEPYLTVDVESYISANTSGLHRRVHIRPLPSQELPEDMHVACSKILTRDYPVGTAFRLRAKLTDREGGHPFLNSSYRWPITVIKSVLFHPARGP